MANTRLRSELRLLTAGAGVDLDLPTGLRDLAEIAGQEAGRQVELVLEGHLSLPPVNRAVLLRTAQEAVVNIRKHAYATQVEIRAVRRGDTLVPEVPDAGAGRRPQWAPAARWRDGVSGLGAHARVGAGAMRVIIADDHRIVREGLKLILAHDPSISIVAEVGDGAELLRVLESTEADVVLLDVRMPTCSGLEVLERLQAAKMSARVIVLSMYDDPAHVRRALEA